MNEIHFKLFQKQSTNCKNTVTDNHYKVTAAYGDKRKCQMFPHLPGHKIS